MRSKIITSKKQSPGVLYKQNTKRELFQTLSIQHVIHQSKPAR